MAFKNQYGHEFASVDDFVEQIYDSCAPSYQHSGKSFFDCNSAKSLIADHGGDLSTNNDDDLVAVAEALERLERKLAAK